MSGNGLCYEPSDAATNCDGHCHEQTPTTFSAAIIVHEEQRRGAQVFTAAAGGRAYGDGEGCSVP